MNLGGSLTGAQIPKDAEKATPPGWGLSKADALEPLQNLEAAQLASLLFQLLFLLWNLEEGSHEHSKSHRSRPSRKL